MAQVNILRGTNRNTEITGTYPLIKGYTEGTSGGFITVRVPKGTEWAWTSTPRIKVEKGDFVVLNDNGDEAPADSVIDDGMLVPTVTDFETVFINSETEDDAMSRICETFSMLDKIVDACAQGHIRGLVVTGPPGIGKSHGVEQQLAKGEDAVVRRLKGLDPLYEIISGGVSSIGLYQKLYNNRDADRIVVFDDCDSVLNDEECLSLFKAALNSGDRRRICWNKESRVLGNEDIPNSFDFEGGVIFLSNIDFEKSIKRGSRIAAHLAAIMSRCHYLDLEIGSMRDRVLRIKQTVRDGMLTSYRFTTEQEEAIVQFVVDNVDYLREVSLRMVKKIADFVKTDDANWYSLAEATCLTKDAKFKRLYEQQQKYIQLKDVVLA